MTASFLQVSISFLFLDTMPMAPIDASFFSAEESATLQQKFQERGESEVEENVRSSLSSKFWFVFLGWFIVSHTSMLFVTHITLFHISL